MSPKLKTTATRTTLGGQRCNFRPKRCNFSPVTLPQSKIGRCNVHKTGAARFARRAFFVRVGPSNFAFCGSVTGEKLHLFGRKLHLQPPRVPVLVANWKLELQQKQKKRHSRSAAALKTAWGTSFNAATLREW